GDNSRVLAWIFDRCLGKAEAVETPIGFVPTIDGINIDGINVSKADMEELLKVDKNLWKAEVELIKEHYARFGNKIPAALTAELKTLESKLA
ncbi:MAG TPA: phosphoenolpyruvate carboxykinase domain-containing protein, partial [Bacteroidales bacterium]|nr:phosphoenolpyruvate carboxykinase domain-containing protein [Bacteroidales bacterium]